MEKTVICNYWRQEICKFMENSEKCKFAHGTDELKNIPIECKYGSFCHNVNCVFFHGIIPTTRKMVYEFPLIIKKSKKHINKNNDIENNFNQHGNYEKVKNLENYNKTVKSSSSMSHFEKNNTYNLDNHKEYSNLNNIIKKLEIENKILKGEIENLKKSNIKNNKMDNEKMDIIYNKYINIYNIFKKFDNNYKIIKEEIKRYTKDNNIYKVKSRATKIYKFYNNLKNGTINEYLPITKIIKMSF
jgi:hypothetical protein